MSNGSKAGCIETRANYGPDFIPKWQQKAISRDSGAPKLEGNQFKFR